MAVDCWLADINDVDSNVKGQRLTAVTTWVDQVTDPDFFFFFFFYLQVVAHSQSF